MFIIEVLKALMRRLLIAGKRVIKALPDEIRDRNKGLLITTEGLGEPSLGSPKAFPDWCRLTLPASSVRCPGDF